MNTEMDRFTSAIRGAIHKQVEDIIAEEAKAAGERVEKRVRGMVAEIAATLLTKFELFNRGQKLVIEVDFQNTQTK